MLTPSPSLAEVSFHRVMAQSGSALAANGNVQKEREGNRMRISLFKYFPLSLFDRFWIWTILQKSFSPLKYLFI